MLKKSITKITVLIIFVSVFAILSMGCATFGAKKQPQKETRAAELNSSQNDLAKKLQQANAKLAALSQANNFLEKQIAGLGLSRKSLKDELNKIKGESLAQGKSLESELLNVRATLTSKEQELKQKIQDLQMELALAREQHKKMAEELNKAATLNASLQQRLDSVSQSEVKKEK